MPSQGLPDRGLLVLQLFGPKTRETPYSIRSFSKVSEQHLKIKERLQEESFWTLIWLSKPWQQACWKLAYLPHLTQGLQCSFHTLPRGSNVVHVWIMYYKPYRQKKGHKKKGTT